jgi:hypothetical protein
LGAEKLTGGDGVGCASLGDVAAIWPMRDANGWRALAGLEGTISLSGAQNTLVFPLRLNYTEKAQARSAQGPFQETGEYE